MPVCRPGSRRILRWYAGEEPHSDRPRYLDVLRHPVTGSSYEVTGISDNGDYMNLGLKGLGLLVDPDLSTGGRLIYYALAQGGLYAHRDA